MRTLAMLLLLTSSASALAPVNNRKLIMKPWPNNCHLCCQVCCPCLAESPKEKTHAQHH